MKDKKVISWALYDWANSAFATTIMAGFFPIFFKKYWSANADVTESTFRLGLTNSVAGLVVALCAPLLGAIADKTSSKKKFLFFFTYLGVLSSVCLFFVSEGQWALAIVLYILGSISFSSGNIFYDSLIFLVTKENNSDYVSSLGFSLGYIGGGLLFTLNVLMTLFPESFFLKDSAQAVRVSFILVGIWWALFSLPLFLNLEEEKTKSIKAFEAINLGIKELIQTLKDLRTQKNIIYFLVGYWFYIDGVDTIIRMAVDYGMALGFESNSLIVALLITQFVGFPATLLYAKLASNIGTKNGIYLAIVVYSIATILASQMNELWHFYALAGVIGLVQGGIQALSRSYYSRLIPSQKAAEYFGLYNMLGKFAVVFGPILMGLTAKLTKSPRLSILSLVLLFGLGAFFLSRAHRKH